MKILIFLALIKCAHGLNSTTGCNCLSECAIGVEGYFKCETDATCGPAIKNNIYFDTCTPQPISVPSTCEAGKYSFDGTSECVPCFAGSFSLANATACTLCSSNTFSSSNSASCTACTGLLSSLPGSSVCGEGRRCIAGSYYNTAFNRCDLCLPGYQTKEGTIGRAATVCTTCSLGTTSYPPNPCKSCPPNSYGSFVEDGSGFHSICLPCNNGQGSFGGTSPCVDLCPRGYFSADGLNDCSACPDGTFSSQFGSKNCSTCPKGTKSSLGSIACELCPEGSYSPEAGSSQCLKCQPGEYSSQGSSVCLSCPPGSGSNIPGGTCTQCSPGTYSSAGGISNCISCPTGSISTSAATQCTACGTGFISNGDNTKCVEAIALKNNARPNMHLQFTLLVVSISILLHLQL